MYMEIKPEIRERLEKLEKKYQAMGQDLVSYLDGLLYADYLTYWDYIHLDSLLSLQNPKTSFPDEEIFIMYHQVTELYFKMMLHELRQIGYREQPDAAFLIDRIGRVNRYFDNLTHSFEIMVDGMDQQQFLKFRMSLLPASGFQSAQYRMVEICSTDFIQLVSRDQRERFAGNSPASIEDMFACIYWKAGATELSTGNKTLTLKQFEMKYTDVLIGLAREFESRNLWAIYKSLPDTDRSNPTLIASLRKLDVNVNVNWPLSHYKSAVRYLHKHPKDIEATGGTNWQKYLPPRFQKRIFYPTLWSQEEIAEWGLKWVKEEVFGVNS
jgi:tryptophan 2,3-dioxygenase